MSHAPVLVQKFGGTSVSTAERRRQVIEQVRRARNQGFQVAVVVSAMGRRGEPYATDTLLDLLRNEHGPVDGRDYDMIFACGEIISTALMAHLLKRQDIPAVGLWGGQAGIYTDGNHGEAEIMEIDPSRLRTHLMRGEVPVITGCQGQDRETGAFTTLGRGGSDTSTVAVGVALQADRVDIYTDVEGVARANPRTVPGARFLKQISYAKMLEMARYGAGVIHPRAVRTGRDGRVPVSVRCTFSMESGTTIADVQDEHPLLGLATLGPLRTVVLSQDTLGAELRQEWERCRQIMSLQDAKTGALLLSASTDKAGALAETTGAWLTGDQAWVSVIGSEDALHRHCGKALDLLAGADIPVPYYELTELRATFVVPAHQETQAVQTLYHDLLGG